MREPVSRILCAALLSIAVGGCAERIPEPVVVPSVPHISWLIASHQGDGNEQVVCQSDPRTDCILPVGSANTRRMATVHLYLHPSAIETRYVGTMRVGFMNGSPEPHDTRVNSTVKPGSSPVNVSVTGLVTSRPGIYPMTLALTAETSTTQHPLDIRRSLSVTVK